MDYQAGQLAEYLSLDGATWSRCKVLRQANLSGSDKWWYVESLSGVGVGYVQSRQIRPISPLIKLAEAAE